MTSLMLVGKKTKPAGAAHTWRMYEGRLTIYALIRSYKSTPSLSSFLPTVLIGNLSSMLITPALLIDTFLAQPWLVCTLISTLPDSMQVHGLGADPDRGQDR